MKTTAVASPTELGDAMIEDDNLRFDEDTDIKVFDALWDVWTDWVDAHRSVDRLIIIPSWFSMKELDCRRPFLVGRSEYDNPEKGAVLFDDLFYIDVSIVENDVYDHFDLQEAMTLLDVSEESDHIDDPGLSWIPRTLMHVFVLADDAE